MPASSEPATPTGEAHIIVDHHPIRVRVFSSSQIVVSGVYVMLRQYPDHVRPCLPTLSPNVFLVDLAHAPRPEVPPSENVPEAWLIDTGNRDAARAATRRRIITIDVNATFSEVVDGLLQAVARSGAEDVPGSPGPDERRRSGRLSARELEVLGLLGSGASNVEIAAALDISVNTIKTYVRSMYRKMGVATRDEAVTWATQNGCACVGDHAPLRPRGFG